MADSHPAHPDISRYMQFLINESPLTAAEHQHFLQCEECNSRMAQQILDSINKRQRENHLSEARILELASEPERRASRAEELSMDDEPHVTDIDNILDDDGGRSVHY